MPDVSKLRLDDVSYDIKDDAARKYLVVVNDESRNATKVNITTSDDIIELATTTELSSAVAVEANARTNADATEASTRASAVSNLQSQINQIVAPSGEAPSAAEVQNARIGADGITYGNLGNAIRANDNILSSEIKGCEFKSGSFTITDIVTGEYYDTATGQVNNSSSLKRSRYLIPFDEFTLVTCDEYVTDNTMQILCYDRLKTYLGSFSVRNEGSHNFGKLPITMQRTAFIGFNVSVSNTNTSFTLRKIDRSTITYFDATYKDNNKEYFVFPNNYLNSSFVVTEGSGLYDLIIIPKPETDTIYTSCNVTNGVVYYDDSLMAHAGTYVNQEPYGRLWTIPSTARFVAITLMTTHLDADGNNASYAVFIRGDFNLSKKRILAIGDSITYIDGRSVTASPDTGNSVGWQRRLREYGSIVTNAGYSGAAYATNSEQTSISEYIVNQNYDVSTYDYIVLFGGTNDLRLTISVGDYNDSYDSPKLDQSTFVGAIGKIVQYIRTNNPSCKIAICTMLPSGDTSRNYTKANTYRNAVIDTAKFWGIPVIDLFTLINATPKQTQWSQYFYDTAHPNSRGMERIGYIIAKYLENDI